MWCPSPGSAGGSTPKAARTSASGRGASSRWSTHAKLAVVRRAATHLRAEQLGRVGPAQRLALGHDVVERAVAGLVQHQRREEREHARGIVAHAHLEPAERDLAHAGGCDAADHVDVVVREVEVGVRGDLRPGHREAVRHVEVGEMPAQRALGEIVVAADGGRDLGVDVRRLEVALPKARLGPVGHHRVEEAVEVGRRPRHPLVDRGADDRHLLGRRPQRGRVRLATRHLRVALGVAAHLQGEHHLGESSTRRRVGELRGDVVGAERHDRAGVEIGALEEMGHDGAQHRELLVGGTTVDVDAADEPAHHGLDEFGIHESGHGGNATRPGAAPRATRAASYARPVRTE